MNSNSDCLPLADWIKQLRHGNQVARDELLNAVYERLVRLTRKMFRGGSAAVQRWEQTDDLLHRAWPRIQRLLDDPNVEIQNTNDFFRLVARQIRFELIDLHRHYTGAQGLDANYQSHSPKAKGEDSENECDWQFGENTNDPAELAQWTEFHQRIDELSDPEREVFDLIWYSGFRQDEVARMLDVDVRTVKRRWRKARLQLREKLNGVLPQF